MGRKQKKKINLEWATKEASLSSNQSAPARNLRKTDLGGVIFGTTHSTINECLSRQLFGLPEGHYSYIKNIKQGLVLFLFNYSDRKLHGIFEAAGPGQLNIDQYAWVADGDDTGYTRYPAQVKICVRKLCHPLSEDQFKHILAPNYYESKHFYFELDKNQVNKLVSLFTLSPFNSSISTKLSSLYASLPENSKRQEYKAHASLRQTLPENLNQTTKESYASTLGRTTSAASSVAAGKWSALFKSELGSETVNDDKCGKESQPVATTREQSPLNQECDFLQADTSKGSHWDASYTGEAEWDDQTWASEAEWDQTWASDLNPEANTTADVANVVQGDAWEESQHNSPTTCEVEQGQTSDFADMSNVVQGDTWEDSQHNSPTTCEVEQGQTSDLSGQHFANPSSSPQPLDDNPDFNLSLSAETSVSDIETNHEKDKSSEPNAVVEVSTNLQSLVEKLMQELEVMKGSQLKHIVKTNMLEQEWDISKLEIQQLRNRVSFLESGSQSFVDSAEVENQLPSKFLEKFTDRVLIVGGHDGSSWLTSLDSYFPCKDIKRSLSPMKFIKRYSSAAVMNGEVYHFSGDGSHTVESFNPANNQWIPRPQLYWKNINIAGAAVKERLFVVGGANGIHCSSEVEYLDMNIGRWLPARSMQSKRLAPAAVELNNVLYVSGGYDGVSYVSTVERFDPRGKNWFNIPSMNTRKGCHSMVVLNEKLYTVGGFSGDRYLATVEYLDTRMGAWVEAESMNVSRGNFGAFVLEGKMYTIGGRKESDEVLDIVECYKEGSCWEVATNMKAIGKRSHFSAFVM